MKIIFFGTAGISKFFLENINAKHTISAVVTMCDKPSDRGGKIKSPAVKIYAHEHNIDCIQVNKFTDDIAQRIKKYDADVGVAVSFGKLIPENIFTLPKFGCFNIHFSLLPQYRGASPVQQVLIDGCNKTGVTSFYIEKGLDTGDILLQETIDIEENDTAETLFNKLNTCGISVMNDTLDLLADGKHTAKKQEGEPSFCSVLVKENGKINWNKPAQDIYNLYRGLYLWPGIFCTVADGRMSGKTIKIIECNVVKDSSSLPCGTVSEIKKGVGFAVKCSKDALFITKVQPESKAKTAAFDFVNGSGIKAGSLFK